MRHYFSMELKKGGAVSSREGDKMIPFVGIASTLEEDLDGEIVDPEGLIFDYFLDSGYINWAHLSEDNPTSIVGEPTKAYVKNGAFVIEGGLYANNPLTQKILQLDEILRKSESKRRLGLSIEGDVLKRNPLNNKRVEKAMVTGCAITPTPKNRATSIQFKLQKGESEDIMIKGVGRVRISSHDMEFLDLNQHLVSIYEGYKSGIVSLEEVEFLKKKFREFPF